MKKTKIVIAGGGFAGLYAAKYFDKHLACHADVEVTLISRENFIVFTPMLHEVAAGELHPIDGRKTGTDGLVAAVKMIGKRAVGDFCRFVSCAWEDELSHRA